MWSIAAKDGAALRHLSKDALALSRMSKQKKQMDLRSKNIFHDVFVLNCGDLGILLVSLLG